MKITFGFASTKGCTAKRDFGRRGGGPQIRELSEAPTAMIRRVIDPGEST
jgi:hypothetical protein